MTVLAAAPAEVDEGDVEVEVADIPEVGDGVERDCPDPHAVTATMTAPITSAFRETPLLI